MISRKKEGCGLAAKASCILGYTRDSVASRSGDMTIAIYSALVRPHLRYCAWVWALSFQDTDIAE